MQFPKIKKKYVAAIILITSAIVAAGLISIHSHSRTPGYERELAVLQNASAARQAADYLIREEHQANGYPETGEIIITKAEIERLIGKTFGEKIVIIAKSAESRTGLSHIGATEFVYVDFDNRTMIDLEDGELITR